jgi:hypothetical protein
MKRETAPSATAGGIPADREIAVDFAGHGWARRQLDPRRID